MPRVNFWAAAAAAALAAPVVRGQVVVGFDVGGPPVVRVYDPFNPATPLTQVYPAAPNFTGGIRVAVGDVSGDGEPDLVTGLGPGGPAEVRAYYGLGILLLRTFNAYGPSYTGGVNVAVGDVDGDGIADIITGTVSGTSHVKVFSGLHGGELASFFAFDQQYLGGVRVGAADVNGDGRDDVLVGGGPGAFGGHVKVFDGVTKAQIGSFLALSGYTGGIYVGGVRVIGGAGNDDILVAGDTGYFGGHIKIIDGTTFAEVRSFQAFNSYTGGTTVASGDMNHDGVPEIVAGAGLAGGPEVRIFSDSGIFITSFQTGGTGAPPGGRIFVAAVPGVYDACYPDCTGDGLLTVADFGCFQTKFVGGSPYADCNGDGARTVADFGCFQTKFVSGCP